MRPWNKTSLSSYHNWQILNLKLFLVTFVVVCKSSEFWIEEIKSWNSFEQDLLSLIFILPLQPKNDQQLVFPHRVNQTHHKNWPNAHASQGKLICLSLFLKMINWYPLERYEDKIRECAITICLFTIEIELCFFATFGQLF